MSDHQSMEFNHLFVPEEMGRIHGAVASLSSSTILRGIISLPWRHRRPSDELWRPLYHKRVPFCFEAAGLNGRSARVWFDSIPVLPDGRQYPTGWLALANGRFALTIGLQSAAIRLEYGLLPGLAREWVVDFIASAAPSFIFEPIFERIALILGGEGLYTREFEDAAVLEFWLARLRRKRVAEANKVDEIQRRALEYDGRPDRIYDLFERPNPIAMVWQSARPAAPPEPEMAEAEA